MNNDYIVFMQYNYRQYTVVHNATQDTYGVLDNDTQQIDYFDSEHEAYTVCAELNHAAERSYDPTLDRWDVAM